MTDWIASNKDLLALAVSLLALVVGLFTVIIAVHQSRLATYARVHELLVQPDVARGRRVLFLSHRANTFPTLQEAEWDQINQALALYDTLGTYVRRRLVPRGLVLAAWHHQLHAIRVPAEAFAEHRRQQGVTQPWVGLTYLLARAEKYSSRPWRRWALDRWPLGARKLR